MILLIDLDGTLTDTAHDEFKPYKDGLKDFKLSEIPLIEGAKEFIAKAKDEGHDPIIVSDSHPKYVKVISEEVFGVDFISLCDKPNSGKVKKYFLERFYELDPYYPNIELDRDDFLVIGDTWLDVELGRNLNISTILTLFYSARGYENRDGIGQNWKHLKSGPTYYVKTFNEIFNIIKEPLQNLLAVEGIFRDCNSVNAVRFKTTKFADGFIAYRTLGRQQGGECDKYAVADKYFEFQRADRSNDTMLRLSKATSNFLNSVQKSMTSIEWDYFSFVSDKATTQPPNKLSELFELIDTSITKVKLIQWSDNIQGSIKNQKDYKSRKEFVDGHINIDEKIGLNGKSIIILDDQFTTGGTAYSVCSKLQERGVKNILFVTLFYLISTVASERTCPHCSTKLQVKVNRSRGTRFLSCVPQKYGGKGCGNFIENII